jgi:hypothetical protein
LIDGDDLCLAHVATEGHASTDGTAIGDPDPPTRAVSVVTVTKGTDKTMTDRARQCGKDGCNKKLNANNTTGFCAGHWYESKRKSASPAAEKVAPAAKPGKATAGRSSGNGKSNGHVMADSNAMLRISEEQLDRMFLAWPMHDKVCAVQSVLDKT